MPSVLVVVIHREVRKGGLGKGFGNKLALLVLEVRVVTGSLLLRKCSSLCQTLLVPALDELGDTLGN